MLTVRGQQHSFLTHEQVFLWMCQKFFETENVSTWGGLEPLNFRIHVECSRQVEFQKNMII